MSKVPRKVLGPQAQVREGPPCKAEASQRQEFWPYNYVCSDTKLFWEPDEGRDIDKDGTALHYAWETWEIVEEEWANMVERCCLCALPFLADDFEGLQSGVHSLCAQLENRWDDGDGLWRPNPLWPY